jgi:hypothetical protein
MEKYNQFLRTQDTRKRLDKVLTAVKAHGSRSQEVKTAVKNLPKREQDIALTLILLYEELNED